MILEWNLTIMHIILLIKTIAIELLKQSKLTIIILSIKIIKCKIKMVKECVLQNKTTAELEMKNL